ncbi:MAG TPA: group 1 truncated hemoglobin [Methylophaga sp.]|nr:group 1 truncated hemoglobin [Methylophaga sp.]
MRLLILSAFMLLSACASQPKTTLYEDLGGAPGIEAIVENFIKGIASDPEIFPYFADSHVSRFREKITEHFCHISDGPCQYTGDNMVDIHVGMDITESHFNRTVDLLYVAMEQENIPHPTQNRLIARLAPLRKQIIYR